MTRVAVVFPGQGTQRVGMGSWLLAEPAARDVVEAVSDACGFDVRRLCARGPAEELRDTRCAQPAVFAVGAAAWGFLQSRGARPDLVAGHSVGELTALWAAGALSLDTAAALVATRGRIMSAMPGDGAMLALSGPDEQALRALVDEHCPALEVALHNGPFDWVLSGPREAVAAAVDSLPPALCRRMRVLDTSHGFHSRLMAPGVTTWSAAVDAARLSQPALPVVLNHDAAPAVEPAALRAGLVRQLTSMVRWHDVCDRFLSGGDVEVLAASDEKSLIAMVRPYSPASAVSLADRRLAEQRLAQRLTAT